MLFFKWLNMKSRSFLMHFIQGRIVLIGKIFQVFCPDRENFQLFCPPTQKIEQTSNSQILFREGEFLPPPSPLGYALDFIVKKCLQALVCITEP
jgi:hypothetical protein